MPLAPTPIAHRRLVAWSATAALLASSLGIGGPPSPARAGWNTIEVTTIEDELNADGDCSLREAIVAANTNLPVDGCPAGSPSTGPNPDIVTLGAHAYVLTIEGRTEDAGATGDLDITDSIRIEGVRGGTSISGAAIDRIFDVAPGVHAWFIGLELIHGDAGDEAGGAIRLRDGCATGGPASGRVWRSIVRSSAAVDGGGIYGGDCRYLELHSSAIVNNRAEDRGGGIAIEGPQSVIAIDNSTISSNAATTGGGIWASVADADQYSPWRFTTIAHNSAPASAGFWYSGYANKGVTRTIVAENDGPDCGGLTIWGSYNVIDDFSCAEEWIEVLDEPGLGPLTALASPQAAGLGVNFTFVHPLLPTSDAIDIDFDDCIFLYPVDQADRPRNVDGNGDGIARCDSGAYEASEVTAEPPQPTPSNAPTLPDTAMAVP